MSTEKRAPLSDPVFNALKDMRSLQWAEGFREAMSIYEAKITSGELRVVKMVGINELGECTECGWDADHRYPFSTCCPGCGNPIAK